MKISVVTVSLNSAATIAQTMQSVLEQTHEDTEHIVIDGASSDATLEVVLSHSTRLAHLVSEPDGGLYEAMNKGVRLASGDVIAFLNSDDCYADAEVLRDVAALFRDHSVDFVYGNACMVHTTGRLLRQWAVGSRLRRFMQIPHPALFVRTRLLRALEPAFDLRYRVAADLKQQLLAIHRQGARGQYLPRTLVRMRSGGKSTRTLGSHWAGWRESAQAYNDIFGWGGWAFTALKVLHNARTARSARLWTPDS